MSAMRSKRARILILLYILVMISITCIVANYYGNNNPFEMLQYSAGCASFVLFCLFKPRGILAFLILFITPCLISYGSYLLGIIYEYVQHDRSRESTGISGLLILMSSIDALCTILLVIFYWSLPDEERRI